MDELQEADIITEADKNKIRLDASTGEIKRLKKSVLGKRIIIVSYRILLFLLLAVCFGLSLFYVLPIVEEQEKKVELAEEMDAIHAEVDTVVEEDVHPPKIYYTVFLKNDYHHPLAQFQNKKEAFEFSSILNKLKLPETRIDSTHTCMSKERNSVEGNVMYDIQVGVYSHNHLAQFKSRFIFMGVSEEPNIFKYSIGSFIGYSKCQEFVNTSNLEKAFIVPSQKHSGVDL